MALLLHFTHPAFIIADVMTDRRAVDRVTLPLIVVFLLTLLAFLPLAIPGRSTSPQPVQGYTTPGNRSELPLQTAH